ncbi:MAG: acetoacetate decarboxylase family protein [Thermodesulfobacteriota bacterium]
MGRLTKEKFGFSVPVSKNASLYTQHPYHYRDVKRLAITYETDLDPVLDILPELVEPLTDPPQVVVTVTDVGFHIPLGPYTESYFAIRAQFKGEAIRYVAYMWVTSDAAMAAGREIYGAPKKLGIVTLSNNLPASELIQGVVERPAGTNIFSVSALLTGIPDPTTLKGEPAALLKVIPDSCGAKEPAIAELLRIDSFYQIASGPDGHLELYEGIGSISFGSALQTDPVYELIPRKIISTYFMKMNIREEKVTLLHRY